MTDTLFAATTPASPEQELAALVAKVAMLSKMSLDMMSLCIDVQGQILKVVASHVAAVVAVVTPPNPEFIQGVARSPTQLDGLFPPGVGDFQAWYVVCVGREPGLYASFAEANAQVLGVPNQFRQKKSSRAEALTFYRLKYGRGEVEKWTEAPSGISPTAPSDIAPAAPVASPPTSVSCIEITVTVD
ncbi:hypothetical protein B0H10DRAFT_2224845 [Mycena sp. CBHHK59/15]|nr:hypothetical protein B0H10DRAFT_2224845 [Mycena sp. CBHHK59/15]